MDDMPTLRCPYIDRLGVCLESLICTYDHKVKASALSSMTGAAEFVMPKDSTPLNVDANEFVPTNVMSTNAAEFNLPASMEESKT